MYRSVVTRSSHRFSKGEYITMQLMKRKKVLIFHHSLFTWFIYSLIDQLIMRFKLMLFFLPQYKAKNCAVLADFQVDI